ncbi:MAG: MarR family transcriptional regulator, partial [Candidatus Nanopelagicales bacterium]
GMGLVERRTCTIDGRGQFAHLTNKGWRKIQAAAKDHVSSVRRHLVDVLGKEFLEFGRLTEQISTHLHSEEDANSK